MTCFCASLGLWEAEKKSTSEVDTVGTKSSSWSTFERESERENEADGRRLRAKMGDRELGKESRK